MKLAIKEDTYPRVSWERDDDDGYGLIQTLVTLNQKLPGGFGRFMQTFMDKNGPRSAIRPREYEVTGVYPNEDILLVEFCCGNTEVGFYEEYFEGEEFLELLEKGIAEFEVEKCQKLM